MAIKDRYQYMAEQFIDQAGVEYEERDAEAFMQQLAIIQEEFEELSIAVEIIEDMENDPLFDEDKFAEQEAEFVEELADLCITCFTAAYNLDVDLRRAFIRKMHYNMQKTGGSIQDGKIQDDADVEKPDFDNLIGE